MRKVGIVAIDQDMKWAGGRYYLQHLIKSVAALPIDERVELRSVSWAPPIGTDAFAEVRALLGQHIALRPSSKFVARLLRRLRRAMSGDVGARDRFEAGGIDVCFPIPPCEQSGTPYVFWLPDFQYLRRPDLMSGIMRDELQRYYHQHVGDASQIVLSSFDAQRDFARVFPDDLARTHVVRFCSVPDDFWWQEDPAEVSQSYGLPDRFLIVCNQFTRHKNHLMLVNAVKLARETGIGDIHLVCTGSTFDHRNEDYVGQVQRFVDDAGLSDHVHILGLVPRGHQIALLRRACAVLQPSEFEGWSTIVEDAKTLGKLVLASDLPVHREQLGPAHPHYLGLADCDAWARAIAQVWREAKPGPDNTAERSGLMHLEAAKLECGRAFARALRAAAP